MRMPILFVRRSFVINTYIHIYKQMSVFSLFVQLFKSPVGHIFVAVTGKE